METMENDGNDERANGKDDWKERVERAIGNGDWKERGHSPFPLAVSTRRFHSPFPLAVSTRCRATPPARYGETEANRDARGGCSSQFRISTLPFQNRDLI
jgi:hypothetical protein